MVSVTSPRHICHIVNSLDDVTQTDLVIANICPFPQPHFEHTLVILNKSKSPLVKFPCDVSCLELTLKGSWLRRLRECRKALAALRPDICQTYGERTFPVQWFAHRLNIPLKLHIYSQECAQQAWLCRQFRCLKYRFLSHFVDVVVSTEDCAQHWLEERAHLQPGKTHLIRSGIDSRYHCPALHEVDTGITNHFVGTVPIPTQRFVVGVPITGHKTPDVLAFLEQYMAARAQSANFARDCLLLLLGDSPDFCLYRHMLENMGLNQDCVRLYRHLPDNKRLYSHIDAIVSLNEEGHIPVSLLEAMSMGLPVISQRDGQCESINDDPLLWPTDYDSVQVQHQLLTLYGNNGQRMELGRASRRYVMEKHNHHEHRLRYRALYALAERLERRKTAAASKAASALPRQWLTRE